MRQDEVINRWVMSGHYFHYNCVSLSKGREVVCYKKYNVDNMLMIVSSSSKPEKRLPSVGSGLNTGLTV
jgi:hypothetical protein